MNVWVEAHTTGSTVWGCARCGTGAWCASRADAVAEAQAHAAGHGGEAFDSGRRHGPKADRKRDRRIARLRSQGLSVRAIAARVGLSNAGVMKALRRTRGADA